MDLFPQETASSLAARLPGARESGLLDAVHHGSIPALERLARLSGVNAKRVLESAAIYDPDDPEGVILGRERFSRGGTIRTRARACPCCLKSDLEAHGVQGMHGRAAWILRSYTTCGSHGVMLVAPPGGGVLKDFHASWAPHVESLLSGKFERKSPRAPEFERYVDHRLAGRPEGIWTDTLRLDVIGEFAKMAGVSLLKGKTAKLGDCSAEEICSAVELGFGILKQGPMALETFFEALRAERGSAQEEAQARYGEIYDWLRRGPGVNPGYEPIKAIFRDHLMQNWPFRPGDACLDLTVTERRFHSFASAMESYGVHHVRLKKILMDAGLMSEDDIGKDRMFPVADLERVLSPETGAMTYPDVHKALDIGRSQLEALVAGDVLCPQPARPGTRPRFARADVEAFQAKIAALPEKPEADQDGLLTIMKASNRLKAGAARVVGAVLAGSLSRACRIPGLPLYSAVRVDLEELRQALSAEDQMPSP